MKILGIDYGEKRIGLAISDESQTFARELGIVSPKQFWQQIGDLVTEEGVKKIVVGWPINMSGHETKKTQEVKTFVADLRRTLGIAVDIIDERLTSIMAHSLSGAKKNIDSLAAQILLQNYLDKNKNYQ